MKSARHFFLSLLVVTCLFNMEEISAAEDWFLKGISLARAYLYDDAIKAFSRAIEENPAHAKAYNNRGAAWYHKRDYDRAIADYTRALDIDRGYADAYNNRGAAWYHKGDYDRAIADYTAALRGATLNPPDMSGSAGSHSREKGISPVYADLYNNRGAAWYHKKAYDRAIADYTSALQINPHYARALINRGIAWLYKGECGMAIDDYEQALDLDNQLSDAYNQLAWTLAVCPNDDHRDGAKAVALANKAVEMSPGSNTLDTLAAAYAEAGQWDKAVATQRRVISLKNSSNLKEEITEAVDRLQAYRTGRPWRIKAGSSPTLVSSTYKVSRLKVSVGNIRKKPTTHSPVVAKLKRNDPLILLQKEGEWYIVRLEDNRTGWAHQDLFVAEKDRGTVPLPDEDHRQELSNTGPAPVSHLEATEKLTVRAEVGRVREGPSLETRILFRLKRGAIVSILVKQGAWYLVQSERGLKGWAHKSLF